MNSSTHLTFNFFDHADTQPMIAWLSGAYADLEGQAQAVVDDYWRRLQLGQLGRKGLDRGNLGLRLRSRENGAFSLEWYRMGHLRRSGRDVSAEYIRRGNQLGYARRLLLRGQPSWLEPIALETEEALVDIRRKIAMIGKIRFAVVQYERKVVDPIRTTPKATIPELKAPRKRVRPPKAFL
jgi:hypothetical protein